MGYYTKNHFLNLHRLEEQTRGVLDAVGVGNSTLDIDLSSDCYLCLWRDTTFSYPL